MAPASRVRDRHRSSPRAASTGRQLVSRTDNRLRCHVASAGKRLFFSGEEVPQVLQTRGELFHLFVDRLHPVRVGRSRPGPYWCRRGPVDGSGGYWSGPMRLLPPRIPERPVQDWYHSDGNRQNQQRNNPNDRTHIRGRQSPPSPPLQRAAAPAASTSDDRDGLGGRLGRSR